MFQASHGSERSNVKGTPSNVSPLLATSSGGDGGKSVQAQRDRLAKKTMSWVTNILTQAFAPKVGGTPFPGKTAVWVVATRLYIWD